MYLLIYALSGGEKVMFKVLGVINAIVPVMVTVLMMLYMSMVVR